MKKSILIFLLFLTSCHYKINVKKEFEYIQKQAIERTNSNIFWNCSNIPNLNKEEKINKILAKGLSRDEAITIALMNNKKLQASLESIGIAKADFDNSQLFSNPKFLATILFPSKDHPQFNNIIIDSALNFRWYQSLSDIWKVPLKSKIFKNELEIAILDIVELIFSIIEQTKKTYDEKLYVQTQLKTIEEIIEETKKLQSLIAKSNTKEDNKVNIHNVNLVIGYWQLQYIDFETKLQVTDIQLKKILGLELSIPPIVLTDSLEDGLIELPNLEQLESLALKFRPEIQKEIEKINKFENLIRYEKSKLFDQVNIGFECIKGFYGEKSVGPFFFLDLPLFNQNQTEVSKAKFLLEQSKKNLINLELEIKSEVFRIYKEFQATIKKINIYKKMILSSSEKLIKSEPVNSYLTFQRLYSLRTSFIELHFIALNFISELEKTINQRILYSNHKKNRNSILKTIHQIDKKIIKN